MLEVEEDECGFGYLGDSARAGGDVLEGAPALGEQGECSFAEAAQGSQERIWGAGVQVEFAPAGGVFHGGFDADSGAVVAVVGQGGHSEGGGAVQGRERVDPGGSDVVDRSGLGVGKPDREPAGQGDGLDVAAVAVGFAGVPQVDDLAFRADGVLAAPVAGEDLARRGPFNTMNSLSVPAPAGRSPRR